MASLVLSILASMALVAAMVAPAPAQSSGGSTGTGTAPTTGSGSSMPIPPRAPSTTQPGSTTPSPGPSSGASGKTMPGGTMGQSGTRTPGTGSSMPSTGAGTTAGTPKSGMGVDHGAGSEQVKTVQKALQDKGLDPGPIDGIMGPKTMAALKAFQKDQKLTESGRLDDQTREKLGVSR